MSVKIQEKFSSRMGFMLVAIASTVGLGNVWRFPFSAGENGGGAFVIVYIAAVLLMAAPLFMVETLMGRLGQGSPPLSMKNLAKETGRTPRWIWVGYLCLLTSVLVLSFYSVIAGMSLAYIFKTATGVFVGASAEAVATTFNLFKGDPWVLLFWHTVFVAMTALIVSRGLKRGIEKSVRILMPLFFLILVFLVIYAAFAGAFTQALEYLFVVDFAAITPAVVLAAVGQAFFTMSIGSGGILTYGAYIGERIPLAKTSLTIAAGDTLVALLAGLAIFPIVFANGLDPAEGAGLAFVTLPISFGSMPFGTLVGVLFFILFVFAAITSAIGMLETLTRYCVERGTGTRRMVTFWLSALYWLVGFVTVLSFNIWEGWRPLAFIPAFADAHPFGIINWVVGNILLLVTGLLFAIWIGYFVNKKIVAAELGLGEGLAYKIWLSLVRYVVPLGLVTLMVVNII